MTSARGREANKPAASPAHLRRFALVVALGLTLIGGLSWWRGHTLVPSVFWSVAAVLAAAGLLIPGRLAPVERAWLAVGATLAWVNTRIILTAVFYLVVTPIAVVMRLFRDPLDRRVDEAVPSYWTRRTPAAATQQQYEQQF